MEHIKLMLTLFNLILGSSIIMFLLFRQRVYSGVKFFAPMALYSLIYNLLLVGALIGKYININLPSLFSFSDNYIYIQVSQILFILLMGTLAYAQFLVWKYFSGVSLSIKFKKSMIIVLVILLIALIAGSITMYMGFSYSDIFLESIGDLLFLLEFVILIVILIKGRKSKDKRKMHLMSAYSFLYLSRYPLILLMLIIPETIRFYSAMFILFYFNLIPIIWSLLFFKRGNLIEKSSSFETHEISERLHRYNITPRESEIVILLLAGKRSIEIEEILYISSHTVKNHIYNIYKKLKIKNRYELINIMKEY
jgi:DNA-binding CsgD family transcriptional regulator